MTKKSREENLNSKIQSVEKRIKELDLEKKKAYKQIEKWNKEKEELKNIELAEFCKKNLPKKYYQYTQNNEDYTTTWYIYFDKFDSMEDDNAIMFGKYISFVYDKDEMVESFTYDANAKMFIDLTFEDGFSNYFKKEKLVEITKDAFDGAKKTIIDIFN